MKYKLREMPVNTAILLSSVIDADHQKQGHFPSTVWVIIGVVAKVLE